MLKQIKMTEMLKILVPALTNSALALSASLDLLFAFLFLAARILSLPLIAVLGNPFLKFGH